MFFTRTKNNSFDPKKNHLVQKYFFIRPKIIIFCPKNVAYEPNLYFLCQFLNFFGPNLNFKHPKFFFGQNILKLGTKIQILGHMQHFWATIFFLESRIKILRYKN